MFGVLLSAICCAFAAIGMLLMKHSATVEVGVPLHKKGWWMLGFLSMGLLPVPINMLALSLAPVALLAPFGGLTIVFSLLLAHFGVLTVRESPSRLQVFAVALVVAGMALVSFFGPVSNEDTEEGQGAVEAVLTCTENGPFMFLVALCFCGIAFLVGSWVLPARLGWRKPESTSALNVALMAFTAAACGALANLILKVVGVAVRSLFADDGRLPRQTTVLCVTLLIAFAVFELYVLNSALANSPVALAVPIFQALLITLQVATGGTFYREFVGISGAHLAGFSFGALLVIIGVMVLSAEQARRDRQARDLDDSISMQGNPESPMQTPTC